MTDFIAKFQNFMIELGYSPDQKIMADDHIHRIKVNGEKKSPHVTYQLKIDGNFAVGWCRSFKEGVTHKFTSKDTRQLTKGEKAAIESEMKARKEAREAQIKSAQQKAAHRAQERWQKSVTADVDHPYILKKQIEPLSARQLGKNLLIPVYSASKLVSLQTISEDGAKRFLTGGKLQGGYCLLAFKNDGYEKIIICEGYATGVSLRMATGKPVLVAFTAANLGDITASVRKKHPDSEIIIAADNDAFTFIHNKKPEDVDTDEVPTDDPRWNEWRDQGLLVNTGIDKAKEVCAKYDCKMAVPEFTEQEGKPTDFNDLHCREGIEAVRLKILQAQPVVSGGDSSSGVSDGGEQVPVTFDYDAERQQEYDEHIAMMMDDLAEQYSETTKRQLTLYKNEFKYDENWQDDLIVDKDGNAIKTSLINCDLFIRKSKEFGDLFCYDEFAHEKILVKCPPWENPANFEVRPVTDDDVTRLAIELEKFNIKQPLMTLKKILDSAITSRRRNPAKEYFSSLQWDGVERLDKWLTYYCGAEFDPPEYLAAIGRKWLTAAVARVFDAGCKFDHMIIFEGDQNAGKSTLLRELSTIYGREYFDDTISVTELGTDKAVPKMQGVLIIEIAEMAGFKKRDSDALKSAITTQKDRIIKKYQNEATTYPRQFVMAGTINPLDGYLHDPTGNRRFWPVKVGKKIDINAIKADREQLWAEAVRRYKEGEKLYLDDRLQAVAHEVQEDRRTVDPWVSTISHLVSHEQRVGESTMNEIYRKLEIRKDRLDKFTQERISKILANIGFEWRRHQNNGERTFVWMKKQPEQEDLL